MKKLLSLAALALMLCVVACQNGGYKITGTINGAQDGDSVFLGTATDTLQTAVIKNGSFTFIGTQDTAMLCYVMWKSADTYMYAEMALENANINIQIDTTANAPTIISGTPANEAITALNQKMQTFNDEAAAIYGGMNGEEDEETQVAIQQKLNDLQERMIETIKTFITENISNVAGQSYLAQYSSIFPDEFVMEQIAALPEGLVSPKIEELKKNYEDKASTAVGQPFADIKAATPEGAELSVSEVAAGAKVLLIDFWASWCGPCRAEMPNVKAAYEKFHPQGFEIIGVSLDNDADAWKQAIADLGITWPQISDLKGWDCEGAATYAVRAIPATVLIKDGKIVARDLRGDALSEKIEELLK